MLYNVVFVSAAQERESALCMHTSPRLRFPSHLNEHRALRRVPCALQQTLISFLFYTCQ